ncbi:MAG: FtsX-like permease family protein [Lachnospiraceae bacterium]|nr:FtsX-like permease family protein [Lachnospiraceae bacterium]
MKSMMNKSTLQEIKQSLGRYLAILAIVALGVGFFAGIKETKPAMVETADRYLKEKNFYDYRLVSTLGFDQKIIDEISERDDVSVVQGAYTFDILCQSAGDGNVQVVKAHSITKDINELEVLHGRLPSQPNECVVDSSMYSHKYIGKKIRLSDSNTKEDLEHFSYTEYKIVGVVESPLYIQFERGNSALGNGKVSGFVYLLPEGFQSDAFTEVYVKLTESFYLYDDAYDDYIEKKEPEWESYLENLGLLRYRNILLNGAEKLADAEKELKEGKEEGEKELADAKQMLDEAALEIEDGKTQLADAKKEIAKGYEKIENEEKKLENALITIAKNEKLLLEKETELEKGIKQWEDGKTELEKGRTELEQGEKILADQESQLLVGQQQLAEKEAELIAGEEQFTIMEKLLKDSLVEIEKQEEQLNKQEQDWMNSIGVVPDYVEVEIASQREFLIRSKDTILSSQAELEKNRVQLVDGRIQLESAKSQMVSGKQQIDGAKQEIVNGKTELESGEKELATSWETIKDGRKQISEGRKELVKARNDIEEGKRQIQDAKEELADAETQLIEKEKELVEGEEEYVEGLAEYNDGLAEFEKEIADAETEIANAKKELQELELPENYLLGRDTNVGYMMFQSDSNIVEKVSTVLPIFFFLVAALVCMTTMSRMIEEQRTQIGTLKALGYGKGAIMGKYMFYSGSAAFIGCVSGYLVGIVLFPFVIWMCYGLMYDMGSICFVFDWKLAILSLAVSLLCSVGTTWYSCHKELNEVAAQLMRPKTPQAGKRILLEHIPFIWNHLKFLQKVSIRNVFRYKKRFFMMVLGISGCAALVLAAFGIKDSIADVMTMQYEEIQIYDMSIMLQEGYNDTQKKQFENVLGTQKEGLLPVWEGSMDITGTEGTKAITVISAKQMEQINTFVDMHTLDGERIQPPAFGEAVISHKIAENLGIQIGDIVELKDEDFKTIQVKISGIMQNFVFNYLYLHPDTYEKYMGNAPEYNNMYLNVISGTDMHGLSAALMKLDDVTAVTINEVERQRFEAMMSTLDYIVVLVLGCAAALAFIVIYNLTNINITERVREIATIKVLGFYKKETATYVFRENILLTLVGALAGLVLGKVFHYFIMECIQIDMISFDVRINAVSYLYSVMLTMLFAVCVNKMMEGKLEKISMTESLKSVD